MYILDANVFIDAKNWYYRFETFPGFWEWLDSEQLKGTLVSIEPICDELLKGNDDLSDWVKVRKGTDWFQTIDDESTQIYFSQIAEWVMAQPFSEQAKAEFLSGGDPWLIAKAAMLNATVVTHETFDAHIKKKVKIPNVCRAFNIHHLNSFDLLRHLGATFTLR